MMTMRSRSVFLILVALVLAVFSQVVAPRTVFGATGCEAIDGIPDFNCDGKAIVAVLGDSFVYGFGDSKNGNEGGYILRTQKKFPNVEFLNLGEKGLQAKVLMRRVDAAFEGSRSLDLRDAILTADVVVIDIGRNDRWYFGLPEGTYRNITRISKSIKSGAKKAGHVEPFIVTAVLMLPNRGSQGPWVKELDSLILRGSTDADPADLRFDLVSKRLLNKDQLHPSSRGYAQLAKTFTSYLRRKLPRLMNLAHPDSDDDGISDSCESLVFGTDPNEPDSDGNGIDDGVEMCVVGDDGA